MNRFVIARRGGIGSGSPTTNLPFTPWAGEAWRGRGNWPCAQRKCYILRLLGKEAIYALGSQRGSDTSTGKFSIRIVRSLADLYVNHQADFVAAAPSEARYGSDNLLSNFVPAGDDRVVCAGCPQSIPTGEPLG